MAAARARPVTPRRYPVGLRALASVFVDHASLLWQFSRREISGRYRGSLIGFGWAVLNPLLLLAIYTFVFSVVFRMRWDGPVDDRFGFALVVYAGMLVHGFFAECMTRAPSLVVDNRNLVKRVVFPLEILPWSALVVAAFHFVVGVVLIVAARLASSGAVPVTALALPLVALPLALLALGVTYAFASLGVYLRDLSQVVGFLALTLLFMSPVFYPASAVPENWRFVIDWNPIAALIEMTRGALLFGRWPSAASLATLWGLGFAVAWLGFYGFQRTRRGFADVL
ncbi:MAG: ABC transporter permease [Burkholderiales bacterium]